MPKGFFAAVVALATVSSMSTFIATSAVAAPLCDKFGFAGLLAKCNRGEPIELTLASGQPLGKGDVALQSGAYYEMRITADGSAEIGISGASFFRAIWLNEVVINGIEVRPMALDSLEFDKAGVATMSFIAIKPGVYEVRIPNTTSDSQKVTISIQ
ncbi:MULTISPECIES: hypothetical protein [Alphaproteobacteria]|uniref:MSP domain-containing protein n=2 Tax=Alphaproteobacteria TaxID=28211 RepID=A0A512HPA4_9HYPH|nr:MULTISPECIES: hypothetical protein [Alphaproteobacteria]GEO87284.1 hypothetical protein RNA01_42160 [Ciceribacter naphthalenivorans]GLR23726.1 hypothetical protein GCM10007920_35180 [Ciceribacter naphthalenivorans]GLT06582.1 hypothetical protein GCM10007926_35180 [Sphingomonas psychrolutea]